MTASPLTGSPLTFPPGSANGYGPVGRSPWLDIDWRGAQRWVMLAGTPVNTIELGSGPPLVFVHGLSGSWPNWLEQLPVLASGHRVITLDLPGFGHSPMPKMPISMVGYAALLDELFGELELPAATVVGNSMGGLIAAELAASHPQRVRRLVLISPAGISTYARRGSDHALRTLRRLEAAATFATGWTAANADRVARRPGLRIAALRLVVAHPARLPPALAAEQLRGAGKPGFMDALTAVLDYDARERLLDVACPTLIVWGDHDRLVPVRDADVFAELIPDSRKSIFADTGHMPMLERPAAFNPLLRDFLPA